MRSLYVILPLVFYFALLALVDSFTFEGRYSRVVLREANYQAQRVNTEVRSILDLIGI